MLYRLWTLFPDWENWSSWILNLDLSFSLVYFHWMLNSRCIADYEVSNRFETALDRNDDMKLLACEGLLINIVSQNISNISGKRRQLYKMVLALSELTEKVAWIERLRMEKIRKTSYNSMTVVFPEAFFISDLMLSQSPSHCYDDDSGLRQALAECFSHMDLRSCNPEESVFNISRSVLK